LEQKKKDSVAKKKDEVTGTLKEFGTRVYDQLDKGVFPTINMPSRSTENINYDPKLRQYVLGERSVARSARNIRHVKPFTQLAWAAMFSNELTSQRKTST
jgi:DNA topoisomerase VI subunit A